MGRFLRDKAAVKATSTIIYAWLAGTYKNVIMKGHPALLHLIT